jgi:hypothetical protein
MKLVNRQNKEALMMKTIREITGVVQGPAQQFYREKNVPP